MNNKVIPFTSLILAVWLIILACSVVLTFVTATTEIDDDYELMVQASELSKACFEEICDYKLNTVGLSLSAKDYLQTGMIGEYYDQHLDELGVISTTNGDPSAKRTSCDPNWAGYIISLFKRAGLKKGDEVGMTFSGSFPAMNISCLVACQTYGLKACVMSGIGASYYGANDPRLPFFEMVNHLCEKGLLTHGIDYLSWGGDNDTFGESQKDSDPYLQEIYAKATSSDNSSVFVCVEDFAENVRYRIELFHQEVPDIKMFINVGGLSLGLGVGISAFNKVGYVEPPKSVISNNNVRKLSEESGLLEYFHYQGLPVVTMLNIKSLANSCNVPYIDETFANGNITLEIGLTANNVKHGYYNFYYQTSYNNVFVIIALVLSLGIMIFYGFYKSQHSESRRKDERNNILCGR